MAATCAATLVLLIGVQPAKAAGCGPGILGRVTEWKDRNRIYDFVAICDWHDRCYAGKGFGWDGGRRPERRETPYPKDWCDAGFHIGMNRSCDVHRPDHIGNRLCRSVASVFYGLVRAFGGPSYRSANGRRVFVQLIQPLLSAKSDKFDL
ncbi:MAG: hypothetical protein WCI34_07060 [Actinomycetes bacterium]